MASVKMCIRDRIHDHGVAATQGEGTFRQSFDGLTREECAAGCEHGKDGDPSFCGKPREFG